MGEILLIAPWMAIASANCPIAIRNQYWPTVVEELLVAADEVGDAGRQQQAGEHPAEGADEQLLDEGRRRADAELARGHGLAGGGQGLTGHDELLSGDAAFDRPRALEGRATVDCLASACSATRARIQSRSARRFR